MNRKKCKTANGFTLIETVIVITITSIVLGFASISLLDLIAKSKLENAARTLYSDLRFAQSESVSGNKTVYVSFAYEDEKWCYGFSESNSCDCSEGNECKLNGRTRIVSGLDFKGVEIQKARFAGGKSFTAFSPRNGFANANGVKNGTIWLKNNDMQIAVIVNRLGRVRFCSPTLSEYSNQCPKAP